ncbi:MAG: plastocyanin/azurin family copper-binding protein [Acidimicrobiales bacterium]|nr:plastocyanin/azurin family copper-binding protein [Acidimicrobiales bacterium]
MHTLRRALLIGLTSLALLGCATDDPLVFEITAQTTTTAPPSDSTQDESVVTTTTVFPPIAEDFPRPSADKFVDFRGQDIVEIEIRDNVFDARFFRVDPGTQIVFVNRGANTHNVRPSAEGAFPPISDDALAGGPQALVLDAPGDYPFYCSIHGTSTRGQTGYVIVGAG